MGLPLVEVPAETDSTIDEDWMAVFVSGDGGWAETDKQIAQVLATNGIPTVGWDALRYFFRAKTPAETGEALAAILDHYMKSWARQRVVVIGFSRGANTAPFMIDRLDDPLRKHVELVALLAPTVDTTFVFRFRDWFSTASWPDSVPVGPAVEGLRPIPVICIYGRQDEAALCPHLPEGVASVHAFPGGHHFGGDTREAATLILERLRALSRRDR